MAKPILVGVDRFRAPPEDVQGVLRAAYPDCFLEWMPNSRRWAVKRTVPWSEVARLAERGLISDRDIKAHLEDRYEQGYFDAGDGMVVHAFTVQDPVTGEPVEPGGWIVEALRRADTQGSAYPGGVRQAAKEVLDLNRSREEALAKLQREGIDEAVEHFSPWLMNNPRSPSWTTTPAFPFGKDAQNKQPET